MESGNGQEVNTNATTETKKEEIFGEAQAGRADVSRELPSATTHTSLRGRGSTGIHPMGCGTSPRREGPNRHPQKLHPTPRLELLNRDWCSPGAIQL